MPWFHRLEIKNIDLGKGKRRVADKGILNKKYLITIPDKKSNLNLKDIP